MTEYQTLMAKKAGIDAQIAAAQTEARALIQEHGLTAADLFPPAKAKPASVGAPKYRDPATGATWTGQGKPPNWILGNDRTHFLIEP